MTDSELRDSDILAIYRELLGREPGPFEIDDRRSELTSVSEMLRIALDSEEYAARIRPEPVPVPRVVNVHHPDLAAWGHPAGTRSADQDAIVGLDGWIFLSGGTNLNLAQFLGETEMPDAWLAGWQGVLAQRRQEVAAMGADMAILVVPDKLAVHERFYPEPLVRSGPRPVERLLALGDAGLRYPLGELQSAPDAYLRTDTHLTVAGNRVLFECVARDLALAPHDALHGRALSRSTISGDLGSRFDPALVEIVMTAGNYHDARIVEDNASSIAAVGGHIGIRRVFENEAAADPRTLVVYGDSFGFGTHAYQGLSWFLAQVFRQVHFLWVPFGWDPGYARQVGAGVVVFQGAERFLARVPRVHVDVDELARETIERKRGLDIGSAFSG